MQLQSFSPAPLQVPSLVLADSSVSERMGGPCVQVLAGGEIEGLSLCAGDSLLLDPGAKDGELVVVAPRGRGRPMLARQTAQGAMALPSGVRCSPSRWQVLGRVVLHQRPQPQAMDKLLAFPSRAQALLPLTPGSLGGASMVLRFWTAPSAEVIDFVAARFGALKVDERELQLPMPQAFAQQGLAQLGAFVRELGTRFGVRVVGAFAQDLGSARAAGRLLEPGAVALVAQGQELPISAVDAELDGASDTLSAVQALYQVPQLALF